MQKQWEFLKKSFEAGRLAHAYLFSGRDIDSINNFAGEFARFINCSTSGVKHCGRCQNCQMIEKGVFADLSIVRSSDSKSSQDNKKDMMGIAIEQIRESQNFLALKPYYGGIKTVVVENAERMTVEAQNCFLKSLEEPRGKSLIILTSLSSDMLLPTVRSRCQEIKFLESQNNSNPASKAKYLEELIRILKSDLAEKFQYAKRVNLEGENFENMLFFLQNYFRSLMLDKINKSSKTGESEHSAEKLKRVIRLIENLNFQSKTTNINSRLALETLLMEI